MNGLYYYKLVSPYPEDVTKNCKLTINEIDSNFLNLKGNDIDTAEFNKHHKMIVLTRKNGEKLYIDLSSAAYDLKISESENDNGKNITFSYNSVDGEKTITIENVMTSDNVSDFIKNNVRVVTDDTLSGFGNSVSPLGIKLTEKTGMFSPAIGIIDITRGGKLPKSPKIGTRFLTKEYIDDYGYLYNGEAISKINKRLTDDCNGWRIPTKEDWDNLLNSIEPCGYENHNSVRCHIDLGKTAGKLLKSECGWVGQKQCVCGITMPKSNFRVNNESDSYVDTYEFNCNWAEDDNKECNCNDKHHHEHHHHEDKIDENIGVDAIGMTILPSGMSTLDSYGRPQSSEYKEKAYFWTSTHINGNNDEDVYVKVFQWNKGTVSQIAECPMPYYSLRLVKDYNGTNFNGLEYIDGALYKTILNPKSGQIWLSSNFMGTSGLKGINDGKIPNFVQVNGGEVNNRRKEIFINEWNGVCWVKKLMVEGDTIVLENPYLDEPMKGDGKIEWVDSEGIKHEIDVEKPNCKLHNIEYRVYTSTNKCDKDLMNTDNLVFNRVINTILSMFDDSIKSINKRFDEIDKEINDEKWARIKSIEEVKTLIENESSRAQDVESDLWKSINGEIDRAQEVESQLWAGINGEIDRAQKVETDLWEGINSETKRAQEVESQLWDAVNNTNDNLQSQIDIINGELIRSDVEYTINAYNGLELLQKNGNKIIINFDGNYGEIK